MDLNTVAADAFGRSLSGLGLNLLVRDMAAEVAFLTQVLGLAAYRVSADFAILGWDRQILMLHADPTYHANPLHALLPEAGPRGAGAELRLYGADPDAAAARSALFRDAVMLQPPRDKPHGLREAYILSPAGYCWVPSMALPQTGSGPDSASATP